MDRIGNYRIVGERSRDASQVVYEARHLVLPRRAIVKVMQPMHLARGTNDVAGPAAIQLLREACILEALEHPGVVRVYESALLPDRRPWFAHERVDGVTVGDLLSEGPLAPAHAAALLRDISDVLAHAHRRGIIHNGLRPDRIAVAPRMRGFPLCITDWGDARAHDTSAPPPSPGAPDFAAPELVSGSAIDDRGDVFALGVIGYRALTGELPFGGNWVVTVSRGPTQHVPTRVRCPDAPPELTGLVDQLLAWDRFDRPSSAEAHADLALLAADLAPPPPPRSADAGRARRPKWTPSLPLGDGLPDLVADDVTEEKQP